MKTLMLDIRLTFLLILYVLSHSNQSQAASKRVRKVHSGLPDELRLLRNLLTDYDTAARPVKNQSDVVEVKMGIALNQIRELHEKSQYLQINAWFQLHWVDPHLMWNASAYGNLASLRIPSGRLWVPDVVLYNNVDETKAATDIFAETNCIVESSGKVLWVIPAMTKSSCKIDITYFPFDMQKCPMKFGSWTYDGFQVDLLLVKDSGDLSKYIESGEWDLISMPAKRNVEYYSCCVEPYVDLTYTIIMARKSLFFTYNLVLPCMLLMSIGVLVFCLPPESGEKVSLGVTVLLAMTVYQLLIAETIPPTSEVIPLIGQFFGSTIFLLSVSTALTVLVMKMHFSGEHGSRVPPWMRTVVLVYLARLVRLGNQVTDSYKASNVKDSPEKNSDAKASLLSSVNNNKNKSKTDENPRFNTGILNRIGHKNTTGHVHEKSWHTPKSNNTDLNDIQQASMRSYFTNNERGDTNNGILPELLHHVRIISEELQNKHKAEDVDEHYKSEWRTVALVIDRLLLITFSIITVFTCAVIFMNVPNRDKQVEYGQS